MSGNRRSIQPQRRLALLLALLTSVLSTLPLSGTAASADRSPADSAAPAAPLLGEAPSRLLGQLAGPTDTHTAPTRIVQFMPEPTSAPRGY